MPRIPGPADVREVSAQTLRDPGAAVTVRVPTDPRGAALEQFGQTLQVVAEQFERAHQANEVQGAKTQAARRLKELESDFSLDQDFATFGERFQQRTEQIRNELESQLTRDASKRAFRAEFAGLSLTTESSVRDMARRRFVDKSRADVVRDLRDYSRLIGEAINPEERSQHISNARERLQTAVEMGVFKAEEAAEEEQQFFTNADLAAARASMRDNPELTFVALADRSSFPNLSEIQRERLSAQADRLTQMRERRRVREEEKRERDQAKAKKATEDARAAELRVGTLRNEINEEQLIQELDNGNIRLQQFDSILSHFRQEEREIDDSDIALSLRQLAYEGITTPEMVMREPNLTQQTKEDLLGIIEQVRQRGGPLSNEIAERQRRRVDQMVGGVRGPLAILDPEESARVANALVEYDQRLLNGEDPGAAAELVIQRFRPRAVPISAMPLPLLLIGTRNNPDIQATEDAILQALDNRRISSEEAKREAAMLQDLIDALSATREE